MSGSDLQLRPVGFVRSTLTRREDAPMQGVEGAPDAWVDVAPEYALALKGVSAGDDLVLISWLHQSDRTVLEVHPRGDLSRPKRGVFATRSPARPNPLGLHRVRVLEVRGTSLHVEPLEAIDGTPIVDLKPVQQDVADF